MTKQKSILSRGFTIVELLIVIVVIGILAALVLNSFSQSQARARDAKKVSDLKAVKQAIEAYYVENGAYPPCNGSSAIQCGSELTIISNALVPKYMSKLPTSPTSATGRDYYYARGWKKNGISHDSTNTDQDYSIGTHLEMKGLPYSGAWGAQINFMDGNN